VSADLLGLDESLTERPHQQATATKELESAVKWMINSRLPFTYLIAFDGRSRPCRRLIEQEWDALDETKVAEAVVVYTPVKGDPRAPGRRVAWGAVSTETAQLALPDSKVKLLCKERTAFTACGETSTHDPSFSGVAMRHFRDLPRVAAPEKASITGRPSATYDTKVEEHLGQGEPLYWCETKSVPYWGSLFSALDLGHVFDLSAGTGAAALACARGGISYTGVAVNEKHAAWLDNLLDHGILATMSDTKSSNFDKELKAKIESYFATALQEGRRFLGEHPEEKDDEELDDD